MDGFSRRAFVAALAASTGAVSGYRAMTQSSTSEASTSSAAGGDTVVSTREELETAFDDLSAGDTIRITSENAPLRTTEWLDIDVDGVTVVGPGVETLIKPANGSGVGGIRIGHNARCHEIDIRGVGYHGNPNGQRRDAERLHGIAVRDATNVTISRCLVRRTYPVRHGDGGSGISVARGCADVRIFDNKIDRYGDRGIQLAGERHMVYGNVVTNGLDRPVACDVWYPDAKNRTARSVSVFGNLLGNSFEGSLIGVARNAPLASQSGYVNVFGNVGFGSHKSFCHVRGPEALKNISVQHNVSLQTTDKLQTDETERFAGIAVDVAEGRNLAIRNNELYGYSGHGVHVDSEIEDLSVQHNSVVDPGLAGIRVVDADGGRVDGNLVTGTGRAGIRLKNAPHFAVTGNYIRETATMGIVTDGADAPTGTDIADNYVRATSRREGASRPAVLVRDDDVRVRGNTVRDHAGPAIAEADGTSGNVYADNWADGDDPWRFASPDSRVRNNVPETGVFRGESASSGAVRVEFDRAYARCPKLAFGRRGAVREVSFVTDGDGNFVGAEIVPEEGDATFDVFVDRA